MKKLLSLIALALIAEVMIAQFPRQKAIIECGTATWCSPCGTAAGIMDQLVEEGEDVAVVEYHMNDAYSNEYSDHRLAYYNVGTIPHPMVDGIIKPIYSSYMSFFDAYEERMAVSSNYTINIDFDGNGLDYNATVTINQMGANNENKILHLVVTESHIPESWHGGEELNCVTRLMLPDQYGTPLFSSKNGKSEYNFEFSFDPSWAIDSCELVAFIQDDVTKEIMQANNIHLEKISINHDVAIENIINPAAIYCGNQIAPVIDIANNGLQNLSECLIRYTLNSAPYEYTWTGDLASGESLQITLPEITFTPAEINTLVVEASMPNGEEDQVPENNTKEHTFTGTPLISDNQLILHLQTDEMASETSWEIKNSMGNTLYQGAGYSNNTLYSIELDFEENDCLTFTIYDESANGICCQHGNGSYLIKDSQGNIFFEGGEFQSEESSVFQIDGTNKVSDKSPTTETEVYPNPVSRILNIKQAGPAQLQIYDLNGQLLFTQHAKDGITSLDLSNFHAGHYLLQIVQENRLTLKKIILIK